MIPVAVFVNGFALFHAFVQLVIRIRLHVAFQSASVSAIHPTVARMCAFRSFNVDSALDFSFMPTIRESAFLGLSANDFFQRNATEDVLCVSTDKCPLNPHVTRIALLEAFLLAMMLVVTNDFIANLVTFNVSNVLAAFKFLRVLTWQNFLNWNGAESFLHLLEAKKRFHVIAGQLLVHRNQTIAAFLGTLLWTRMTLLTRAKTRLFTWNFFMRTLFVTRQRTNMAAFHFHSAQIGAFRFFGIRTTTQFHAMLTEGQILF
jgi:hypothetical protein